jgi:diadenosine tetraphosphate (Ap4A) HIT family hydrolase
VRPSWIDAAQWASLMSGATCPFCTDSGPRGAIATLESSTVTMTEDVHIRGYCCVVLRKHATELHALSEAEGAAFMRDVQQVARVVQQTTGAIKLNYEIHGNVLPHIHLHVIPRYPGDSIERTGDNFAKQTEPAYAPGEFAGLRDRIIEGLKS